MRSRSPLANSMPRETIPLDWCTPSSRGCEQRAVPRRGQITPVGDRPWGLRDFRVVDPDNYYLRITSFRPSN
jgi:hypothetical protein